MSDASRETTEIVIRPGGRWFQIRLKPLWDYRDLLLLMVRRDFVSRFKQTILGPIWFFINPLVTTVVFTVVFGKVANLSTDGLPQPLFYNCGLLLWTYFSTLLGTISTTFSGNAAVLSKVYFPRLVIPVANTISALFSLGIQIITFAALFIVYKNGSLADTFSISPWAPLLFPLLVLQSALIALGAGFWLAALTVRYRDLSHVTTFLIQLLMYATPVIYPLSRVPEGWAWLAALNPMTAVVEGSRILLLGAGTLTPTTLGLSLGSTLLLALTGLFAFQMAERTFVDTV